MTTFAEQLRAFAAKTERNVTAVHESTVVEVKRSWVEGSSITGAPALPIATGNAPTVGQLRRGVRVTYSDPTTALVFTTVPYAPEVEDNPRGVTFTSGGANGHKLTVAGFPRIVETVAKRIVGGAP